MKKLITDIINRYNYIYCVKAPKYSYQYLERRSKRRRDGERESSVNELNSHLSYKTVN